MEGKNVYHNKVFSSHKPEIEPITMTLKKAGRTATTSETEAYLLIQQGAPADKSKMLVIPSEQVETLYRNLNRFRLSLHRVPILVGEYEHASELEVIPAKGRLRVLIKACGRSIILELGTPGYKNPLKSINLDTTILENIILDLALILTSYPHLFQPKPTPIPYAPAKSAGPPHLIANRGKGVKRVAKKLVFDKCLSCQAKIGKKKNWKKSMINRYRQSHPLYAAAEKEAVAVGKLRKLKDTMGNLTIE